MAKKKSPKPNSKLLINKPLSGFKFKSNFNIGSLEAESDQFLEEVFVDRNELSILVDTKASGCVIVGRTGSGKTALLKQIEAENVRTIRIRPEEMSLQYLSNSTILKHFEDLQIKLDLFYKTLWKHVFVVEFLKMYCGDEKKFDNVWTNLLERINGQDHAKKAAIKYLNDWKDTFWKNTEHRIKEMETSLEKRLVSEFNLSSSIGLKDALGINAKFGSENKANERLKSEIVYKAQSVMNEMQMQDITEIIRQMKLHLFDEKKTKYIIVIDDLDKEWIDKKSVYPLIRAMLDAIKDLKEIPGTKIVIALRENLLRLVLNQAAINNRGLQREKYKSLLIELKWTRDELLELINKRLTQLMKHNYTNASPKFSDILKGNGTFKGHEEVFDYMIERTLMRPRDIIAFFNICIKNVSGKGEITINDIKLSEAEYSKDRLQAIVDEWQENHNYIQDFVNLLRGTSELFSINDISERSESYVNSPVCTLLRDTSLSDENLNSAVNTYREKVDLMPFMKYALIQLYNVGVLGVKVYPHTPYEYSFDSNTDLHFAEINEGTKFCVHKTFHRALNTKPSGKQ